MRVYEEDDAMGTSPQYSLKKLNSHSLTSLTLSLVRLFSKERERKLMINLTAFMLLTGPRERLYYCNDEMR